MVVRGKPGSLKEISLLPVGPSCRMDDKFTTRSPWCEYIVLSEKLDSNRWPFSPAESWQATIICQSSRLSAGLPRGGDSAPVGRRDARSGGSPAHLSPPSSHLQTPKPECNSQRAERLKVPLSIKEKLRPKEERRDLAGSLYGNLLFYRVTISHYLVFFLSFFPSPP